MNQVPAKEYEYETNEAGGEEEPYDNGHYLIDITRQEGVYEYCNGDYGQINK
jgi:hypothetical protein